MCLAACPRAPVAEERIHTARRRRLTPGAMVALVPAWRSSALAATSATPSLRRTSVPKRLGVVVPVPVPVRLGHRRRVGWRARVRCRSRLSTAATASSTSPLTAGHVTASEPGYVSILGHGHWYGDFHVRGRAVKLRQPSSCTSGNMSGNLTMCVATLQRYRALCHVPCPSQRCQHPRSGRALSPRCRGSHPVPSRTSSGSVGAGS